MEQRNVIKLNLALFLLFTLSACSSFRGQDLQYATVPTGYKNIDMQYGVYTPPNWTADEKLPLVLFLHGGGDSHTSFEKFGAHKIFDQAMSNGEIPRAILVTPNGKRGFWENWADGSYQYRDWVMDAVLPSVQRDYNTLACPEHCHLLGISMGGFGAMRFAYFEPEQFSSISVLSAAIITDEQKERAKNSWLLKLVFPFRRIFGEPEERNQRHRENNFFVAWPREPALRNMRLQLIWGDQDHGSIKRANEQFHQTLVDNNIEHDAYVYQGKHKWVAWLPNLNRAMNFLLVEGSTESIGQ